MPRDNQVTSLETRTYVVPTDAPEADGTLAWNETTMVLVRVAVGGLVGLGWTYGPRACATVMDDQLRPVALGSSGLDVERTHDRAVAALRNVGRPGIASLALSALDNALWDLKARLLDLPLHRLLGRVRDAVPVYGSGGFTTYDDNRLATQVEEWLSWGTHAVKIKIGESWGTSVERDIARVQATRRLLPEHVELFVDANGAYTPTQAETVWAAIADQGVTWFEEPVSSDDLSGLRRVRDHVGADVAAGEYAYDPTYVARMCEAGAVDCMQLDVTRCGGIRDWRRSVAIAAGQHLPVSGHCAPSQHVAVASCTPQLRHLEYFHDHVRIEQMFFDGSPLPRDGAIQPPDGPGNGLTLREADAGHYRVA